MRARFGRAALLLCLLDLPACGGSSPGGPSARAGWETPEALGTALQMGSLAGDGRGDAVAVWVPPPRADEGASIVARRFAPAMGWAPLETIDPPGPSVFQDPVAAMDAQGNIMAVWPEPSGLLASRFATVSGWDRPTRISREYPSPFTQINALPAVGFYSGGRALSAWTECCGGSGAYEIGSNRFDATSGWLTPEVVWGIGSSSVAPASLSVATTGSALAVWAEQRGASWGVWMSTFDPRPGWAVSQPVGAFEPAQLLYGIRVALNDTGTAFALWTRDDTLYASRYTTVTGFATPEALGRGAIQGLAVDAAGNALALAAPPPGLRALRYTAGRGWEPPLPLEPQDTGGSGALSMDAGGNAWFLGADSTGVWSRRYTSAQGLGPLLPVAPRAAADRVQARPQIAADVRGGAVAVWLERPADSATWTIMANRFTAR